LRTAVCTTVGDGSLIHPVRHLVDNVTESLSILVLDGMRSFKQLSQSLRLQSVDHPFQIRS
jgi:hypothetical protein